MAFDASEERHSAAFFNPQRDFWWNDDYLRLLSARFGLGDVRAALDVGSGVGHWGTLLLPLLSPDATLVGVERDPRWITDAERRASELGVGHRCRYLQGVGEALRVEDESFDLVTCQTFLIHVADVAAVISEMVRALRPGGLLLVAEPNNLAGQVVANSITAGLTTQQLTERFEFSLICERGKTALGEGDSSVGDLLPGYFARAGLRDVQTFLDDKAFELVPPYAGRHKDAPAPHRSSACAPRSRSAVLEDGRRTPRRPRARVPGQGWAALDTGGLPVVATTRVRSRDSCGRPSACASVRLAP